MFEDIHASYVNQSAIWWVLNFKDENIPIGYAGIWKISKEHFKGELGYALSPDYHSKGFMSEAIREIINFGFTNLNLHRLEANIEPENIRSINLLKKFNFKQDAFLREDYFYNGEYQNSIILSKLSYE